MEHQRQKFWLHPTGHTAALVVLLLWPTSADAQTFSAHRPPSCDASGFETPLTFRAWGPSNQFDLPTDPNCVGTPGAPCPHHANNLRARRQIVANAWTDVVELRVDHLDLDDGDSLHIGERRLSGSLAEPVWASALTRGGSGDVIFTSDASVTRPGFAVERARVCGPRGAARTDRPLIGRDRVLGVLQGPNDVVELQLSNNGHPHVALTLTSDAANSDFDLYARCGAVPTPAQYTWAARSFDSQEFVDLDLQTCGAGTIYIAVHAYRGQGAFSVLALPHLPSGHRVLTAGTQANVVPDTTVLDGLARTLERAARRVFGATEGNVIFDRVVLHASDSCENCAGAACMFCFKDLPSGAGCPQWAPQPQAAWDGRCGRQCEALRDSWMDERTVTHELLHEFFCLDDEYTGGIAANTQCGHSVMANQWGDRQNNVCTAADHNTDGARGIAPSKLPSAHTQAEAAGVSVGWRGGTPDNDDFTRFDFNGAANVVERAGPTGVIP